MILCFFRPLSLDGIWPFWLQDFLALPVSAWAAVHRAGRAETRQLRPFGQRDSGENVFSATSVEALDFCAAQGRKVFSAQPAERSRDQVKQAASRGQKSRMESAAAVKSRFLIT